MPKPCSRLGLNAAPKPDVHPEIDVEVFVEHAPAEEPIDEEVRGRSKTDLGAKRSDPVRRGAEKCSAGKIVIDRLIQEVHREEWTDQKRGARWREGVTDNHADPQRVSTVGAFKRRLAGDRESLSRPHPAKVF
jgi:hypothetical protein